MKNVESPPQVLSVPGEMSEESLHEDAVTAGCLVLSMSWPDLFAEQIPDSFIAGLKDIEEGRVVELDVALTQEPSD